MRTNVVREEIQRLLKQAPFRPFLIALENGEQALVEHPENIAFDPSGTVNDFYLRSASVRLFSTFDAVTSIAQADHPDAV